jgi:hypothetical protein
MFEHMLHRFRRAARDQRYAVSLWDVRRHKERKALRVIVMQVTEQQQNFTGAFGLHQLMSQRNDARTCIKDDDPSACIDLNTSRIAAILNGAAPGVG